DSSYVQSLFPGSPYSLNRVEDGRIAILRQYRDRGYIYAKVFADVDLVQDTHEAHLSYRIEEGPQVHLSRVLLRGNQFTRNSIIRSRLTLNPGDTYRLDEAIKSQRQIAALGVFSSVRVRLIDEETVSERKDLVTEVEER